MHWSRRALLSLGALALSSPAQALTNTPYNRLAFGPRPDDLENHVKLQDLVEEQLYPELIDDSACEQRLSRLKTLKLPYDALWRRYYNDLDQSDLPLTETVQATFLKAVYSKRQLQCVLADFWHNHFNVYGPHDDVAPLFVHYDRDVIRRHALGNFRAMLQAVAQSPAMLFYLDNYVSSVEGPNENYARELLELHTLGVGSYSENDVFEVARCFTGWTLDEEELGTFRFEPSWHDRFNKLVLGRYFRPDRGLQDGLDVLDLLASHPATARHVCRKLCRRLVADNPPAPLVDRAARLFTARWEDPDQLRQVVRLILTSPEFARTTGEKLKRPFEFTVSFLRATDAEFQVPDQDFLDAYALLGQPLFERVTPDGYPDRREDWTHTMSILGRFDLATRMVDGAFPSIRMEGGRDKLRTLAMSPEFQLR